MSRPRSVAARAAAVVALLGVTGLTACTDQPQPEPAPPPATSTPLEQFATHQLTIARAEFCSRVAPAAVEEALGGPVADATSYGNGDTARLTAGVKDVSHEFGCTWKGPRHSVARAWVFAPPVTVREARALRAEATGDGCRRVPGAPAYGHPSVAVRCGTGERVATAYHGLFGDAWLSCSLEARGEPEALLGRTGRWCVSVAQAAIA